MKRISTNLRKIRELFWIIAICGAAFVFTGLTGFHCDRILERTTYILFGLSLLAGCGGTLALSYDEVPNEKRFIVQVIVRVGFMALAPTAGLYILTMYPPDPENLPSIARYAVLCSLTVVPFGLSLVRLIWKEHKKTGNSKRKNAEKEV